MSMKKKIIGLYELITGVFGVIIILANYVTKGMDFIKSEGVIQQIILGVILFSFIAYAGYGLLNNMKNARKYSMFLQAMQIPLLGMSTYIYKFTAAGFLAIGIENGKFSYFLSYQPIDFTVAANVSNNTFYMIYIVPAIILYGLIKMK